LPEPQAQRALPPGQPWRQLEAPGQTPESLTALLGADDAGMQLMNDLPVGQQSIDRKSLDMLLGEMDQNLSALPGKERLPVQASATTPQRMPMFARGDEYADVRANGGAFDPRNTRLDPEEAAAEDEFWSLIAASMGRR